MLCPECEKRRVAEGHDTCYPCHVRGVSFTYRSAVAGQWNGQTMAERQREAMSNPNVEPI